MTLKRSPMARSTKPMARGMPLARSVPIKKKPRRRKTGDDKRMRDACRGQPCWMRIPGVCRGRDETVVPAHRNEGKGIGLKVPDTFTVPACFECHAAYDQGSQMTREEKRAWFDSTYHRWSAHRDRPLREAA